MGGLQGTCADINNMHGVLQSLSFAVSSRLLCVSHGSSAPADGNTNGPALIVGVETTA